jgi:hypothetical protein
MVTIVVVDIVDVEPPLRPAATTIACGGGCDGCCVTTAVAVVAGLLITATAVT